MKDNNGDGGWEAPGTFIIALIFLAVFTIFYLMNWKWLTMVWQVK